MMNRFPAASTTSSPRVSIGLPVFNGARFVGTAIESILSQSFKDLELIVVDNASTDSTVQIVRQYEASDPRLRLVVNDSNIGAAANFNRALDLAQGEYFKWAAHDDLIEPEFVARCVAALDRDSGAVLAYPKTIVVDEHGSEVSRYDLKLATDSQDIAQRFDALLGDHMCYQIFGVIRREAFGSGLSMGSYSDGDGVLLARLALRGRFIELQHYDFRSRRHGEQSIGMLNDRHAYAAWFNPRLRDRWTFPTWRMQWEYFRSIGSAPINFADRLKCYRHMLRWTWNRRTGLRTDITFHIRRVVKKWGWEIPHRTAGR